MLSEKEILDTFAANDNYLNLLVGKLVAANSMTVDRLIESALMEFIASGKINGY